MLPLISTIALVIVFFAPSSFGQPFPVPEGAKCDECGMTIDGTSKFVSEVADSNGRKFFFCDIGDMLYHFRAKRDTIRSVSVRDYTSGKWIDGKQASYVVNKTVKTPMGWGIAAFAQESEAKKWGTSVGFTDAFRLVR